MCRSHCIPLAMVVLAILLGSATGGCPANPGGSGSLRLLVTDKPYPVDLITSAEVTITRIEVRQADDEPNAPTDPNDPNAPSDPNDADADEAGFVTIFTGTRTLELLDLRNGRTDLLAETEIPAGTYDQMRLIVSGGRIALTDGREFELEVPSGEQTGIKLHFTFEVAAEGETTLLLDVDLSRAFKPIPGGHVDGPGDIREFKFQPSLGMRLIDVLAAGSIAGAVADDAGAPLESVLVTAYAGASEVTSTVTEADGTYVLGGLPTGTYRVEFSLAGYADLSIAGVEVTAGEETAGVDAVLTAGTE